MNTANVNLAPKPVGNKAIQGEGFSSFESSAPAEDFANALKDQEKIWQEPKAKDDQTPAPQQHAEAPAAAQSAPANAKEDNHQALVALLEEYFPLARKDAETDVTTPDATAMLALSAGFNQAADADKHPATAEAASDLAALTADAGNLPISPEPTPDMGALLGATGAVATQPTPVQEDIYASPAEDGNVKNPADPLQKYNPSGTSAQAAALSSAAQGDNPKIADGSESFEQALTEVTGAESPNTEVKAELLATAKPVESRTLESLAIAKPLTHPGWSKDLGEHILWLNNKELSAAEIKLNPVNLGPISVRIDIGLDNQTSILFTAQHPETKEALEASMPKLKEMLQGQQLNLVNVNISQNQSGAHQQGRPSAQQPFRDAQGNQTPGLDNNPQGLESDETRQVVSKGLLSLYA